MSATYEPGTPARITCASDVRSHVVPLEEDGSAIDRQSAKRESTSPDLWQHFGMRRAWGVSLVALFAALLVGMPAAASNTAFTASRAPGIDGVATGLRLNAVDCSSPGNCVAVGSQNGSGAIDVEKAGKWKAVTLSARTGAGSTNLTAVSCPAPGSCVAVGTDGSQGVIETQAGSKWKGLDATGDGSLYPGSYEGQLSSVSCPAAGSCAAVGQAIHDNSMGTQETDGLIADLIPSKNPGKPSVW